MAKSPSRSKTLDIAELLQQATMLHQRGQLADAERCYRQVLNVRRDHPETRHYLGILRFQQGRSAEALELMGAALKSKPGYAEAYYNRGNILAQLGRFDDALADYDQAVTLAADYVEAHQNRGNVLLRIGRDADALASYDRVLALYPNQPDAHNNRGAALKELGRLDEALASHERAVALRPGYVEAMTNCGHVLLTLGRPQDALARYDAALALAADYVEALNGRANVLFALNHVDDAIVGYERALKLKSDHADTLCGYARALEELSRSDEALALYDRALAAEPDHVEALYLRGNCLRNLNRLPEARASYAQALALAPEHAEARFAACMAEIAVSYQDEAEIAISRAAYARHLEALCSDAEDGRAPGLAKGVGSNQPFYLAYQGLNDRALQKRYGELVCRLMAERYPTPALPEPPRDGEPVRIGIVSGYFRQHSNWKIPIRGWMTGLDRRRFRLLGYHTGPERDAATDEAAALCERFVRGPLSVDGWRAAIAADRPHVLIYPEVGMHPMASRLAAQRLAPVQCNSWGHPDTSGFPTLDYYLSSDLMEPPDGEAHYTERLVRLPNLSINYEPLDITPASTSRAELGLRDDAVVYWCGQSLYKYLPQYDEVFARIAREVPNSQFAFIRFRRGDDVTELFLKRLTRAFAAQGLDANRHAVFLPRLDQSKFLGAVGRADIFLDSLGWSGCNSLLESLAHNLPVVTMPGVLMRGRHGSAILTMMDVTETIAPTVDEYIAAAARLGRDPAWRTAVKARMAASKHRLYGDRACITALEDFLSREIWAAAR
ncbi:MAG: tetratricopeptide repeat protein [Xanthobacteraceae bacterium]|nr:tetratricopeptide repeat protein [Xanthobacteraceae bacterium]